MPLVTSKEMFQKAYEGGYAVGAFNVNNMEIIQGITEAAAQEKAPLILQVSAGARKYAKHVYLMKLVEAALEDTGLPICLHLDHGDGFEICKACVDGGFTSVMIDGSKYSFEENIALTKQVVDYAHDKGVVVEGELGRLAGVEDDVNVSAADSSYTDPAQVEEFVSRTGVDSLAIAIGTSHGAYKFKPEQCTRDADGRLVKTAVAHIAIIATEQGKPFYGSLVITRFRNPFQQFFPDGVILVHQAGLAVCRHDALLKKSLPKNTGLFLF